MEKGAQAQFSWKNTLSQLPFLVVAILFIIWSMNWAREALGINIYWISVLIDSSANFAAVFLGIFIEAAPYLLMGTIASGLVEVFIKPEDLFKLLPRNKFAAVLSGSILGMFFPVCECGTIPLARRLMRKGMPVSVGVAFLLAAPVINPIVIASTLAAFGFGTIFWLRIGFTLTIAIATGIIFSLDSDPGGLLRQPIRTIENEKSKNKSAIVEQEKKPGLGKRLKDTLIVAGDEFFEMGRYLVMGALLAAFMQTLVPQSWLLSIGQGPIVSVIVLSALAVLLSICSTVDSFIALAFTGTFSSGAILAFLVYGPMVDIKAILMYLRVFKRRKVVYLVFLPLLMVMVTSVLVNLLMG